LIAAPARRVSPRAAFLADRRKGLLFYNTLFDENAAGHIAL
jgi:leucyl aminopeptidase (aminopeptidase T)